jgi:U3 small nucleolar RNA-associated protein 25
MIRGARHIIFYSLPEYCQFYPELVNLLREHESDATEQISCTVLFTRFERMALERIVGESRSEHMLSSGKSSYMFC